MKEALMERTKEALRRALNTPHETHKEMVERRRNQGKHKRGATKRD